MDDDEELASLRAMRKAKLGDAGITRVCSCVRNEFFDTAVPPCSMLTECDTFVQGEAARVARETFLAPEEDDMNELPEEFRAQLPMSFGA